MPYNPFPQKANSGYIYRACMNKEDSKPFDSIKRIAYNPAPDYIGRANLIGKGVGYGASSIDTAAIEVCQDSLRKSQKRKFELTIGKWIISQDIHTAVICYSKKALETPTDLIDAYNSITKQKIEEHGFNKKQLRIWNLKNRFFAEQFAKSNIICDNYNDYLFSALYSNTIFKSKKPNFDCIWYPSQAYNYIGFNIAYKPLLFDSGILKLQKAYCVSIEFQSNYKYYPKINILKETDTFKANKIIW